jgi:ribosomal protein L11 methyltransferase
MSYIRWIIKNVTTEAEPLVTGLCVDYGAAGVSEKLEFHQPDLVYEPEVLDSDNHSLEVYFIEPPREGLQESLMARWPTIEVSRHLEDDKDWLVEWKKGYKAFPLVGPYWVVPSWEQSPVSAKNTVWIDPGMAFGTGTHETTQLAAHHIIEDINISGRSRLIDVGTGTGILAILACRENVKHVVGIEIDVEARRVARENLERNLCTEVQILDEAIEQIGEVYDVVVANIIDGVLLNLKEDLLRCMAPGGVLVLSGVLQERADHFFQQFLASTSLKLVVQRDQGEWVSCVLERGI